MMKYEKRRGVTRQQHSHRIWLQKSKC